MKFLYHYFFLLISVGAMAQTQLWKDYFSYNDVRALTAIPAMTYFATDNSVIVYNDQTQEKKIFNTVSGFRLDNISTIAYSGNHNKLIVGNKSGNIAIINLTNDNITYLNDIANKNSLIQTEKVINKILVRGGYAYVATGYGISEIRIEDNHFGDSFYIGNNGVNRNIVDIATDDEYLYAIVANEGIKKGKFQSNLIDYSQWELINTGTWTNLEFINNELTAYGTNGLHAITNEGAELIINLGPNLRDIVQFSESITFTFKDRILISDLSYNVFFTQEQSSNLKNFSTGIYKNDYIFGCSFEDGIYELLDMTVISPNGPYSNDSFRARYSPANQLWVVYGGHDLNFNPYGGGIKKKPFSVYSNDRWHTVKYETHNINATADISFDPRNDKRAYISSYLNGIVAIDNIHQSSDNYEYTIYNHTNTDLSAVEADQSVRVQGITFDKSGIGWVTSSISEKPLAKFDQNMQFTSYNVDNSINIFMKPAVDDNGTKWLATLYGGVVAFNEKLNKTLSFTPSNSSIPVNAVNVVKLDRNNQLWIGTRSGLRIVPNVNQFMTSNNVIVTNIVLDDNGTAQELFYQQNILDIYVDGSNNKWVSIADAGVFYISPNGQETIYHFDTSNSPLPSNNIHTISLNETTGEVFFATNKGIVSFTSVTSTVGKDDLENVFAYPNPVRPEFQGEVTISGLMEGSTIKITDTAGNLVYETTATGGSINWNTFNFQGNKVPSGVYIIFITSKDGMERASRKLTIVR